MSTTIQTRRGTAAQAATSNPVLAAGEIGRETDTGRIKFGDGATAWKSLPYAPGTRFDQGEALAAKLDGKTGTAVIYVAGDSTGNESIEWPRLALGKLAAASPDAQVVYSVWDDTAQALSAATTVQAGTGGASSGVKASDNFNRSGDLKGSTSSGGAVWGGDANAAGDWTVGGGVITRTSDTTLGKVTLDSGVPGDRTVAFGAGTISTAAQPATAINRLYVKNLDNSNTIYGYLNVATTGAVTWGITRTIAGTSTSVTGAANPIPANSGSQAWAPSIAVAGTTVTFSLGNAGNSVLTMTMPQADADALSAATADGVSASPNAGGLTLGPLTVTVTGTSGPALSVTMYNGSVSGTTLDYQSTRLAAQCPATPDLVMISSVHNYGAQTPTQYLAKLDAFLALVAATWPTAGVVVGSQNPEKAPGSNINAHLLRCLAIRGWAAKRGVAYLPVIEAFRARTDLGAGLVKSDGIHPTTTADTAEAADGAPATTGSQLWQRVVTAWLTGKRLASAPST
ncbi:hypothetical protein GCM10027047_01820 [Rhodococcus aerolatus]